MISVIPNTMDPEQFQTMTNQILKMNTGVESFVYNEMLHHRDHYDPATGIRHTSFESIMGNKLKRILLVSDDGELINCEMIVPPQRAEGAILYVHGAAFMRRLTDINLKTADRLCSMTGNLVCVPDYRVGADYTYEQMVNDIIICYRDALLGKRYRPEEITIIADSSGCVSVLQALREFSEYDLPTPGKIVLWSPQYDNNLSDEKINAAKSVDLSCMTNDLFSYGRPIYVEKMGQGKPAEDMFPASGNFTSLAKSKILIQSGNKEIFTEDAYHLYNKFSNICPCELELYDDMFHNFQTYYSVCEMAKHCWVKMSQFIKDKE